MSIGNLIKTIQDIMRKDVGVDGDAQRISQIVWLLFLKIFDDKELEWRLTVPGYKSAIPDMTESQPCRPKYLPLFLAESTCT